MCVFLFSFFHSLTFFVEVILAVRVIWIDVSTFECIFESICRAGHSIPSAPHQQSSRARIPGVPKIGVQNLLLHTAKVSYDGGNGLRFYSCPSKRGKLLTRFTFHPFFQKGMDDGPSHLLFASSISWVKFGKSLKIVL